MTVKELGDNIIRLNDGRMEFTIGQASKIVNCWKGRLPGVLHEHGILVRRDGTKKMVNAYDIAELMLSKRIAPIDDISRGG